MPEGVRQSLLDQAVGGQVEAGCQGPRMTGDGYLDRETSLLEAFDQAGQLSQPWGGRTVGSLTALPQNADHAAHLGQGLPAGRLDGLQRFALGALVIAESASHRRRL